MNLIFLSPFFLYFIPASFIPLIIHLILSKKSKIVFIPSIIFWKKILKEKKGLWSLKNILLIIIRMLLILGIILLFAEPIFKVDKQKVNKKNYIFVDRSYSMLLRERNKTLKEEAEEVLKNLLDNLKGESVSLYFFDESLEKVFSGTLRDFNFLDKDLFISYKPSNFGCILEELSDKEADSRVLIISDFNRNNFKGLKDMSILNRFFTIFLMLGKNAENSSINKILKSYFSDTGETFIRAEIKGNIGKNLILSVFSNNKKKFTGILNIKNKRIFKDIFFNEQTKELFSSGYLEISKDNLSEDNLYYFSIKQKKKMNIGILNGSPSNIFYKDEIFYLKKALESGGEYLKPWEIYAYQDKSSFMEDLYKFDLVFLVDVGSLEEYEIEKIRDKKVAIFPGDKFIRGNFNNWNFIPAIIYGVKEEKRKVLPREIFKNFKSDFFKNLYVNKFLKMKSYPGTNIFFATDEKEPLLVGYKNKYFIFGFTASTKWSEIPLKSEYPVLIRKIIELFLKEETIKTNYNVGDSLYFKAENDSFQDLKFLSPENKYLKLNISYQDKNVIIESEELKTPGIYRLKILKKGKIKMIPVAVNLNIETGESEIKKEENLFFKKFKYYKISYGKNYKKKISVVLKGKPVNNYLIFLILVLFILDIFISRL